MTYDLNITFDDNLITGNKTIDTQHKELIERIQNFVTACQNGDSKLKAIKMLDYLDEYTNFHFKEEEKLQENAGYPEYEKHHEKHEEFKKTIQELQEYLQDYEGPTEQFSELKIIFIEFKHIFECLGLTLHYLLKKHIVLVISYIILSRGNHLYRIRLLIRCELQAL